MPSGGARPNSGPEKGTKYAPTLAREAAEAHYRRRWQTRFDELIDAQFSTAVGVKQFVYRDEAGRFKVIDDPDELREKVEQGLAIEIVTRLASPQAQIDVLSRIMGKAKEQVQEINLTGQINIVDVLRRRHQRQLETVEIIKENGTLPPSGD